MLKDVISVRPAHDFQLVLRFEDGLEGTLDISVLIRFEGIFAPLRDLDYFQQVRVDPATGTITWPNGADIDPDVLYSHVSGPPISLIPLQG